MRRMLPATALVLVLTACSNKPRTFLLHGSVLATQDPTDSDSACLNFRTENAAVVVRNEAGTVIGSTTTNSNTIQAPTLMPTDEEAAIKNRGSTPLTPQQSANLDANIKALDAVLGTCLTTFTVQIPKAQFYQVTVGTHGGPIHSLAEMQQMNWTLALSFN